jgi:hypothetical protein
MKRFFSRKVLIIVLGILVVVALYLRSQIPGDLHVYPIDDQISLKRIDYFSHYQLIDEDKNVLLDRVNQIGMSDSVYYFFNETGEVLSYGKNDGYLEQIPSEEIADLSKLESYKPWALTDSINNADSLKLALKLVYFAMIIILVALLVRWIRKKA